MKTVSIFMSSINVKGKDQIKYKVLSYFHNSIKNTDDDYKVSLINDTKNIKSDVCCMLSFFNPVYCRDQRRKELYNNNKKSQWVFFEANALARYRIFDFKNDNEFLRVCLDSPYHSKCRYVDKDPGRWKMILKKTGITVEPWRKKGDHILLILNTCKYHGYSMENNDIHKWVNDTIKKIRDAGCKRKIIVRFKCTADNIKIKDNKIIFTHNNEKIIYYDEINNIKLANTKKHGLLEELKNAWACVLYSTTACVISVVKGIPVFCTNKNAITYNLLNTDISKIENPHMIDRTEFFNDFARQIWSLEEINNGKLWNKIKNKLI